MCQFLVDPVCEAELKQKTTNMNNLSTRNTTILFIALPVCNMYLLKCLFLPDPRDDLGGMDVARKVRYLTISHSINCILFLFLAQVNSCVLHELLLC